MSFKPYPKYKESGVEWLGRVPEHWEVRRLKRLCRVFPSNVDKKTVEGEAPVLLCNYTDVYYNDRIVAGMEFMPATATDDQIAKFTLRAGDTIITKDSETADDIAVAAFVPHDLPGVVCGYHLSMVRPRERINGAFVKRLFDSAYSKACFAVRANGLTRVGLSQYELDNVDMPVPPPLEQAGIATFLDHETAKIDALIAEQQRLIELLQEKRQAVISHAVTKGLNPDAPMKDSRIEWLGEVPEHWEVAILRRLNCLVQTGPFGSQLHAEEYVSGGTPVVNPTHMIGGQIVPSEDITVTDDVLARLPHQRLLRGDVVFSRRGDLGRCALVTETEEGWLCGTGSMILRLKGAEYASDYFSLFLSLDVLRQYFESFSVGTVMDSLSAGTLLTLPAVIPPRAEQRECVVYARTQARQLDELRQQADSAIALLQERRSALISAAVTGQIDVRDFAPGGDSEAA